MLSEICVGKTLSPVVKHITQERINSYAEASGDFNPIHIDEAFAAQTPLGGTIAHGMLILAYASEMMAQSFGRNWNSTGKFSIRFKAPARPGDTITATGKIDSVEDKESISSVNCSIECCSQNGETIIMGGAAVRLSPQKRMANA